MKTHNSMTQKMGILWKSYIILESQGVSLIFLVGQTARGGLLTWQSPRSRSLTPCTRRVRQKVAAKKAGCCQGAVTKHTHGKSQFPQSEMVLGTVSPAGVGGLCSIRPEVGAAVYQPIWEHFMVPSVNQLYGDADFILQQYLVPLICLWYSGLLRLQMLGFHLL